MTRGVRGLPASGTGAVRTAGIAATVLALCGLVAAPVFALAAGAWGGGRTTVVRTLDDPGLHRAVWHTVVIAMVVTVIAVATGTALALAFERATLPASPLWRLALVVPVVVPQFVLTLSWTQAYGPGGLSERLTGVTLPGLYGPLGIAVLLVVEAVPLAWLVVGAGLAVRREPDLNRAARASGAGAWRTFATVDLPLLRGPLLAATSLVSVGVVNSFAVPQVLGSDAGFQTLATLVYQQLSLSAGRDAFGALSVVSLVMVLLVLAASAGVDRGLRGSARQRRAGAAGARPTHVRTPASLASSSVVAAYILFATAVPLAALLLTSLTRAPGLAPIPANWTVQGYRAGVTGQAGAALGRSVLLSLSAAVVVTLLAGAVVGLGGEARRRLGTAVTLGFALPGSALAVGLLIAYGRFLDGSVLIILVAYVAKFWAVGHRALAAGADRLAPEWHRAGRVSGASPLTVLRTVTTPLMATGVATSAGLVALFALHELTLSSILYGPLSTTYAVIVLDQQQLGDVAGGASSALILTLPPALVLAVGALLIRRRDRRLRTGASGRADA